MLVTLNKDYLPLRLSGVWSVSTGRAGFRPGSLCIGERDIALAVQGTPPASCRPGEHPPYSPLPPV